MGLPGAARWALRFQTRPKGWFGSCVLPPGGGGRELQRGQEDVAQGRLRAPFSREGAKFSCACRVIPRGTIWGVVVVPPELPSELRAR